MQEMFLTDEFGQGGYGDRAQQADAVPFPIKFAVVVQELTQSLCAHRKTVIVEFVLAQYVSSGN